MKLSQALAARMLAHGELTYPEECCGLLVGPADGPIAQVVEARNVLNELHASDPDRYPRDARSGYVIDPQEQYRVMREAEAAGQTVRGIYHSHVDVGAYFSEEDKARALPFGEPAFPGAVYIVVDVTSGRAREAKAFVWDPTTSDFVEEPLETEGSPA